MADTLVGPWEAMQPLRGAVLGLGMMGRHHARILQSNPAMRFAGAVDPGGDRFGAVTQRSLIFATVDELLAAPGGAPDFAVIAVPTEEHLRAVRELAAAGVHVLVEKPLAATADEARELIGIVREAGIRGAVGHVERCNPALRALRTRVQEGLLGDLFVIATERVGPFPDRVRDIGVVKDLATHDPRPRPLARGRADRARRRADPAPHGPPPSRISSW